MIEQAALLSKRSASRRPVVAVIYHMFPHYRAPVMRAMAASRRFDFRFFGSHDAVDGIPAFAGDARVSVGRLRFLHWRGLGWIDGAVRQAAGCGVDAIILIGNPNYPSTWLAAVAARLQRRPVFFWAHGWLRSEPPLKRWMRNLYFGLADGVLVYADRARELAAASGFSANRVHPIYNSLDWDRAAPIYETLSGQPLAELRRTLNLPLDRSVLICTARLTPLCRFDLLIEAAARLETAGRPVSVVLVGDGPSRPALEAQARSLGVDARFMGAVYAEEDLAPLIYAADLTVSPGKVGLTAMHSLTYGAPVVTHGDLDHQMPEVEAVVPGRTGAFFRRNDAANLAQVIADVLSWPRDRAAVRADCRAVMAERYTPQAQTRLIEQALDGCWREP